MKGFGVTIVSPDCGTVRIDPKSFKLGEPENAVFWEMFGNGEKEDPMVAESKKLVALDPGNFVGIFSAGGTWRDVGHARFAGGGDGSSENL